MKTRGKARPNIAICYDFDGTLIRGNMQENSFFDEVGMPAEEFWGQVKTRARKHDMEEVLAYMQLMVEAARRAETEFNRKSLIEHGKKLKSQMFPGVEGWFDCIRQYCVSAGATVEHFIISSGIREMIEGSGIARKCKHIFASGFSFDANDVPDFAARAVNYTTKTQYLFRINKGILNSWDNENINRFTAEEDWERSFSRMVYIGDGETDVPSMKMVNYQGGYSIVVYPLRAGSKRNREEMVKKRAAEQLVSDRRAQFVAEANYEVDGPVYELVTMLVRRIVDEYRMRMNLNAR